MEEHLEGNPEKISPRSWVKICYNFFMGSSWKKSRENKEELPTKLPKAASKKFSFKFLKDSPNKNPQDISKSFF